MLTIFVLSTEICGAKSVEQMTKQKKERNNTQPSEKNNQQFIIYKHTQN